MIQPKQQVCITSSGRISIKPTPNDAFVDIVESENDLYDSDDNEDIDDDDESEYSELDAQKGQNASL